MEAITVLEPWASLIACGAKKIETRSWATKYRGKIAIHAGMQWDKEQKELIEKQPYCSSLLRVANPDGCGSFFGRLKNKETLGRVIAVAELRTVLKATAGIFDIRTGIPRGAVIGKGTTLREIRGDEYTFGNYPVGGYAWILENVQSIDPVPARGRQRIWTWDESGWKK